MTVEVTTQVINTCVMAKKLEVSTTFVPGVGEREIIDEAASGFYGVSPWMFYVAGAAADAGSRDTGPISHPRVLPELATGWRGVRRAEAGYRMQFKMTAEVKAAIDKAKDAACLSITEWMRHIFVAAASVSQADRRRARTELEVLLAGVYVGHTSIREEFTAIAQMRRATWAAQELRVAGKVYRQLVAARSRLTAKLPGPIVLVSDRAGALHKGTPLFEHGPSLPVTRDTNDDQLMEMARAVADWIRRTNRAKAKANGTT